MIYTDGLSEATDERERIFGDEGVRKGPRLGTRRFGSGNLRQNG